MVVENNFSFHGQVSKRKGGKEIKKFWMKDHVDKLLDVTVNTLEEGLYFDPVNDPSLRKLVTETVRLRNKFGEAEKELSHKKARQLARVLGAMSKSTVVRIYCDSFPDISDENVI